MVHGLTLGGSHGLINSSKLTVIVYCLGSASESFSIVEKWVKQALMIFATGWCVPGVHCSLLFSCSVMSDYLQPHRLQHTRLPCPSPPPGACSNSCPSNWWCHPTISSSVIPFSSCPQSFPASGSFQMGWLFTSGGQSTGALASASVLPMDIQDWFPLRLTDLTSLQSKGLSRVFSNTTLQKHWFFGAQLSLWSNSHPYMTTGKTIALTRWTFVGKMMSLLLILCLGLA